MAVQQLSNQILVPMHNPNFNPNFCWTECRNERADSFVDLKNAGADKGYATGAANSKNTCLGRTAKFRRESENIPGLATLRLI